MLGKNKLGANKSKPVAKEIQNTNGMVSVKLAIHANIYYKEFSSINLDGQTIFKAL